MQTHRPVTVLAGRYALEQELGRSGTGMAWRAEDRLLGRTVTVKLIHPSLSDDPAFAGRLAEEARRVASLSAPGFARLLDTGEQDGVPFLVREHVDGASARTRLEREGPLPPREAVRIAVAALDAIAHAHDARILHLALGLENVLLTAVGDVRVTDLGIGAVVTAARRPEEAGRVLGGRSLAPELAAGGPLDERTDVFAVGAMLFELLTGEAPGGRLSPRDARSGIPRTLDRVVARALAPDPAGRFQSARAFAAALASSVAVRDEADEVRRRGWLSTWLGTWIAVPLAIAVVAVAMIGLGLWFGRLEVGGPLGIRPAHDEETAPPSSGTRALLPLSVATFDPFGDGTENDSNLALAIDGDRSTPWRSENYFDGSLHKPGVGLVFDLGGSYRVAGFRLWTPNPGFVFHVAVGDDPQTLVDAVGDPITASPETRGALEGSGRYVLVWITTVVPTDDGIRAEIAEFRVVVEAA